MIKEKVVLRSEVYHVYSSEQQERMKVYFDLTQKYQQCMEVCKSVPNNNECGGECEKIYDDYAKLLASRYEGDRKELIDEQVSGLPTFDRYLRKDRGWFYKIFSMNFNEIWEDDPRQKQQV